MCKIKNQLTDFKIWRSMVLLLNTEDSLHNICLMMDFKSSLGMLISSKNDIQKRKITNLIHSQSSMGPIVSMEIPLVMAYLKVSHIMGRVWQVNSFRKSTLQHLFNMVNALKK